MKKKNVVECLDLGYCNFLPGKVDDDQQKNDKNNDQNQ
jgi:hypothetical protein